ncbi:MAG: NUDIX hydrolase [Planctomycetota bacterium]|jgi:ADP-ribose pyrophosphatase YjhB (NUDIX family)
MGGHELKRVVASFGYLRDVEGRLLMVANDYGEQGVMWGVPGGSQEDTESAEQCVVREFAEEVGVTVAVRRSVGVIERLKPEWNLDLYAQFFEVDWVAGEPRVDPEEEHVVEWRYFHPEEIEAWPHPVLGRRRLLDYLAAPEQYPKHIVMQPEEE